MLPRFAESVVISEVIHVRDIATSHFRTQFVGYFRQSRLCGFWIIESPETAGVQPIDEVFEGGRVSFRKCDGAVGFLEITGKCCFEEVGLAAHEGLVDGEIVLLRPNKHGDDCVIQEASHRLAY